MRDKFNFIIETCKERLKQKEQIVVAIDGRCAAGKTTLAKELQKAGGCNVIHMDDFFLRPWQRTSQRLQEPGGNVDYERFLEEVMLPLNRKQAFSYRPYNCRKQAFDEAVYVVPQAVTVIEGSYSCHPALWNFYDLHIFLTIEYREQLERIRQRNGEANLSAFREKWIPLEESYFLAYRIEQRCDFHIQM